MGLENTPPASPGVGGLDDDDQIYDDEIAEEIDVGEGVVEVRRQICLLKYWTVIINCWGVGILNHYQFRMIWRKKTRKKS